MIKFIEENEPQPIPFRSICMFGLVMSTVVVKLAHRIPLTKSKGPISLFPGLSIPNKLQQTNSQNAT